MDDFNLKKNEKKNQIYKIKLDNIALSERLTNRLKELGIENVGQLIQYKKKDFLSLRNFGVKSLNEVISFLKEFNLELNNSNEAIQKDKLYHNIEKKDYYKIKENYEDKFDIFIKPLNTIDFSERVQNCFKELNVKDIGELIQLSKKDFLSIKNLGKKSFDEIVNYLNKYNLKLGSNINWPPKNYTELLQNFNNKKNETIEINENILVKEIFSILKDKEKFIIQERYLYGKTLESIGLALKVTRERIRQIESKALRKIKKIYSANLNKYLDFNKNFFFIQYSIIKEVVTYNSLIKEKKNIPYPLSNKNFIFFLSIDILYKNISNFFSKYFFNIENGWYRGNNYEHIKNYVDEIIYQLDKKPIPRQAESLRKMLGNISREDFEVSSLLAISSNKYFIYNGYFCTNSVGKITNKHLVNIHSSLYKKSKYKFLYYNEIIKILKNEQTSSVPFFHKSVSRLKYYLKDKKNISNHLFIFLPSKLMPIGHDSDYFNYLENKNFFSDDSLIDYKDEAEIKVNAYDEAIAIIYKILDEKEILSLNELAEYYVEKISKNIKSERATKLLSIWLNNNIIFDNIAPSLWSLTENNIDPQKLAEYHIKKNYSYGLEMYILFRKSGEKNKLYKNWNEEFEMYMCLNGKNFFSSKIYDSLISVCDPISWKSDDEIKNRFTNLKKLSNFYLELKHNGKIQVLDKKKKITKYNIENIYKSIIVISENETISIMSLNFYLGWPLKYSTGNIYLSILSIAGILSAPMSNLELYNSNKKLLTYLKSLIIDELIEFGNISWSRNFGKEILNLISKNIEEFKNKDNWITRNL